MSTPVNMAAIDTMGQQFNTNVFKTLNRSLPRLAKLVPNKKPKPAINTSQTTTVTAGTPTKNAPGNMLPTGSRSPGGLSMGSSGPAGITTGKIATPYTPNSSPNSNTGPNRLAIGSGRQPIATPYQPPARVIPMSSNAALTNRVNPNFSFSDAGSHSPMNRTQFNQPSETPFSIASPAAMTRNPSKPAYAVTPGFSNPTPKALPMAGKAAPVGPQFADVSPKNNSPFPTHVHPEGSSNQILPNLTAAQPRPNQFTVRSRNVKGGGIAAMGSQLEAGLSSRPLSIPQPRKRV